MAILLLSLALRSDAPGWETLQLSEEFTCEGASIGDIDGDGRFDVVIGPFWWSGPGFAERHRYYDGQAFDSDGYSDHFFSWVRDLDGDGDGDILVVGFPGEAALWFENPGAVDSESWQRHLVIEHVDGESPLWTDLFGDGREELVALTGGRLCWFAPGTDPSAPWSVHPLSEDLGLGRFTHGLGVGDVTGDGRADVLLRDGVWVQPASLEGDPTWRHVEVEFGAGHGGAQMLVTDVDGDGDGDVITSRNAHGYGLAWFENVDPSADHLSFEQHDIMGKAPGASGCPLAVSELHALALADINGDGVADFVTGRRYKSHKFEAPGATDPPYLLWFETLRGSDGVSFQPHIIHDHSGVGTQVCVGDLNGDGWSDVVVGNKLGAFVHLARPGREELPLPKEAREDFFPDGGVSPHAADGRELNFDFESGDLRDWTLEGEAFAGQPIRGDTVTARRADMSSDHIGRFWIGGYELLNDGATGKLVSEAFVLEEPYLAFLIAGGGSSATRVDIVDAQSGARIASVAGRYHESLRPVVLDLARHVGERVRVVLVDESGGGWGHLNFDHLRLYAERPSFPDGLEVDGRVDVRDNAGLSPEDAARAMTVPEGFHVDLIAGEPDIFQPIALAIDARGRIWVAEAYSYPEKQGDPAKARDQIVIFEDTDADGSFETRKVFYRGLDLVSGLEVGYGGVFVGQAPELLFIPDRNGDDLPDGPPEVLLDGWGYQDTHETLNALLWGPDGWLYGCQGVFTHSRIGAPGTPDSERIPFNAGIWRYHPRRHTFEVFAWGTSNPWGIDYDERGQMFTTACVIPHLYHVIQGARYLRQSGAHFNPYIYQDIGTIADHVHYLGDTPHSGNGRSDDVGGGHAHCGALIYSGGSWPEPYADGIYMFNIHGNRLNHDLLERRGSGFVGHHGKDFLLANDGWFRGINLRTGPDGQVYFIDWYDKQACHYVSADVWNRTNGRLYRVRYGEEHPVAVNLEDLDEAGLIDQLDSDNSWYARTAARLLAERGLTPTGGRRLRRRTLDGAASVRDRLRALWALHGAAGLDTDLTLRLLRQDEEDLRAWAVQLACENRAPARAVLREMELRAASDPSPVVRLYLASALQRIPRPHRWALARTLLTHSEDAKDANIPLLLWYGIEPLVAENPRAALSLARICAIPRVAAWIRRRAAADPRGREACVEVLARTRDRAECSQILDGLQSALLNRRELEMPSHWPAAYAWLREQAQLADRALVLAAVFGDRRAYPDLRAKLADSQTPRELRELVLDALVRGKDPQAVPVIISLLDEKELCSPALRALGAFDAPSISTAILARWESYDEAQRRDAVSTLTSRSEGALALLDAMEEGRVAHEVIGAFELRKLEALGDSAVLQRLGEVWGIVRRIPEDREAEIAAWLERLTPERIAEADRSHGRAIFARTCARCHVLFGEGESVGPDLTGGNRGETEFLLRNIIDPAAIIPQEYQVTIVQTVDGRLLTGIVLEERPDALVLRTENERLTLARSEIEAMRRDANSMMPEGQLATLSEEEVRDLFGYLQGKEQAPLPATAENLETFFDGKTLAGWSGDRDLWRVEEGVLVGESGGLSENAFLISDLELGDFRLEFDVLLDPDAENSGLQFRSQSEPDGGVRGYQADIGRGYWGNLYDERGRGLLVNAQKLQRARPAEWNHYEVVAVGNRILTAINGVPCVDYTEESEAPRRGRIAVQLHAGGPLVVRVRFLRLELDPKPELRSVAQDG